MAMARKSPEQCWQVQLRAPSDTKGDPGDSFTEHACAGGGFLEQESKCCSRLWPAPFWLDRCRDLSVLLQSSPLGLGWAGTKGQFLWPQTPDDGTDGWS